MATPDSMPTPRLPGRGRVAVSLLAAAVASLALARPASAGPQPPTTAPAAVTVPVTTTTAPPASTTTTRPPTTTSVPGTTPPTTAGPPASVATTVPAPPPGPPTTLVNPADVGRLLGSLNVDLAKMSAVQAFAQAKALLAAAPPAVAVPAAGLATVPPAPDPALVEAAAAQVRATKATGAAVDAAVASRRRLNELAVAYYVHADVASGAAALDPAAGTGADPSVILGMLFSQERSAFDTDRRSLAGAFKAQAAAKAHSDQLVAAKFQAVEAAARLAAAVAAAAAAAAAATTTTSGAAKVTVPGTPTTVPPPSSLVKAGYATSGPTILGLPILNAAELADWFASTGHNPGLTVPLATLTALYQTSGATYGVRDDIAFAQSIIETGYFGFPRGGQLTTANNNFAGIGACDSCSAGTGFATAADGVAAQLQLLHNYASPQPLPGPLGLTVGPTGCCPTWMSLTGVWATASYYGFAILTLYRSMLEWVLPRLAGKAGL